jgi:hypothetical protein
MGVLANFSLLALVSGERLEHLERNRHNGKERRPISHRWITNRLRGISVFHHQLLLTTTVTGYLASFLLAALAIAATKHFNKPAGVEWSQAYFFAIFSAGAYFLISCFMLFSVFEARHQCLEEGDYPSEPTSLTPSRPLESHDCTVTHDVVDGSNQTVFYDAITTVDKTRHGQAERTERFESKRTVSREGRTSLHQEYKYHYQINTSPWRGEFAFDTHHHWLMFYTVLFLIYILLIARLYTSIEGWRYLDSVYWAIVTALTIGFGDIKPVSSVGRGLVCLVAPIGMLLLGIIVYHIGKIVLEEAKSTLEEKMKSRKREKEASKRHYEDHNIGEVRRKAYERMRHIEHSARLKCQLFTVAVSLATWLFLWLAGAFFFHLCEREQDQQNLGNPQQTGQRSHWTYVESLYMAQAALLTVGYGDFSPQSEAGRSLFVLWAMLAVPTTTVLIASMVDAWTEHLGYKKLKKIEQKEGKRFLRQSDPYKHHGFFCCHSHDNEDYNQNEKSPRLPSNHESYDKTHIAAMLLKDVIYDHFSDEKYIYDFNSWEWFLYVLGAVEEPPHEEPTHVHGIHEEWSPQRPWDWLGDDTAIASKDSETKWIIQKLVNKLVRELLDIRKERAPGLRDGFER